MDYPFLSETILFEGIHAAEIENLFSCLSAEIKQFTKGDIIYHIGDIIHSLGLVLSGNVQIENDDIWGNKNILDSIGPGLVFGETYACIPNEPIMVTVTATENSEILFLNINNLLKLCSNTCTYHTQIIHNLLTISAKKNINLSRRIFHTSSKTIRGRLLSYLSFQVVQQNSLQFTIPFNRQQLADYLSVDRSALSNELSKMQREGLLTVSKNSFCLSDTLFHTNLTPYPILPEFP